MDAEVTTLPLIAGRYRLLRQLAVGGMGELYLATARDDEIEGLEQLVVIKRILPEYASDPSVVTMFFIEARIAARLDHPNVVRVYDIGRAAGSIYFTMEFLHGADLGKLIDAARQSAEGFPLGRAVTIALGLCAGLHFAHEMRRVDGRPMGIVHRDVSPNNVFITYQGEVKLLDFGIAKVASSTQLTQAGMRKGKVAYMAPEQVRSGPIDRRTDVFAVGILLYEMVTLTNLFDGPSEYEIMEQIVDGRMPLPSTRRPGIPPALEQIILKALAYNPQDRYQTALELGLALEQFATEHQFTLSLATLRQYLKRTIGDVPFPWYSDEADPGEAAAVEAWYRGAQPEEEPVETEDLDVNLSDMFELDDDLAADADEPFDEPLEQTRVAAQPLRPRPSPPPQPPPRDPTVEILRMVVLGAGTALLLLLSLLAVRRCRSAEQPPAAPVAAPAPAPAPAPPSPPKPAAPTLVEDPIPTPADAAAQPAK